MQSIKPVISAPRYTILYPAGSRRGTFVMRLYVILLLHATYQTYRPNFAALQRQHINKNARASQLGKQRMQFPRLRTSFGSRSWDVHNTNIGVLDGNDIIKRAIIPRKSTWSRVIILSTRDKLEKKKFRAAAHIFCALTFL